MAEQSNNTQVREPTDNAPRGRRTRRLALFVVVLLVIFLVITFIPTYIARYLIISQLDALAIQHAGIDSVRINLWKREAWAGPVQFHGVESKAGQLAEFGIKVNFLPVFKKHAMIERVLVQGIDVVVARDKDDIVTLNGIPLQQFFPTARTANDDAESGKPWGAGLDGFELRDSQLIFEDKTGGVLTVEIKSLLLRDFASWHPDESGTFSLVARVNDIDLNWTGEARPFAKNIYVSAEARTDNADLAKISRFIGPLGLERDAGVYNSQLKHEVTFHVDGHLQGQSVGKVDVMSVDYARAGKFELLLDQSRVELDIQYTLDKEGDLKVSGNVDARLGDTHGAISGDNTFRLEEAHFQLADLNSSLGADRTLQIAAKPQYEMKNAEFSGHVQLSVDRLLNLLRYLQSLSVAQAVAPEQTGLDDWADKEVTLPKSDVKVAHLHGVSSAFEFTSSAGDVAINLSTDSDLRGIEFGTLGSATTVRHLQSTLKSLRLRTGGGALSLHLDGRNIFQGNYVKGPVGEAKIKNVNASISDAELELQPGEINLRASVLAKVDGSELLALESNGLPETSVSMASINAMIKNSSLKLSEQQIYWHADAEAGIEQLKMDFGKGEIASAGFRRLEVRKARVDQDLNIETERLIFDGLEADLTRRFIDALLKSIKSARMNRLEPADDRIAGDNVKLIKAIQQHLLELGYAPGVVDGRMGARTENAIRTFEEKSGRPVTGSVSDELLAALQAARSVSAKIAGFSLKLGRFELENGAKFRFRDTTVQPEVKVDTVFKNVELLDVDSRDSGKQAKARVIADVNEFTHIELQASASALGPKANLQLDGGVENLELPPYSSYAAEFAGVNLDSGQLTSFLKATARQGNLDGTIMIDLEDVQFTPLSEQDAKRLADTAGVPIETAVGLLQDSKGRIKLSLPITGTVTKPDVDLSSAVNKAIGGALKKILPSNLFKSITSSADKAGGVSFEPIKFAPGGAKLDQAARDYADKLVELLQTHPKLSLDVCGRSTAADLADRTGRPVPTADQKSKSQEDAEVARRARAIKKYSKLLLELAVERTRVVRRYMITDKGIDPRRVAECRAIFDAEDLGSPRADILL